MTVMMGINDHDGISDPKKTTHANANRAPVGENVTEDDVGVKVSVPAPWAADVGDLVFDVGARVGATDAPVGFGVGRGGVGMTVGAGVADPVADPVVDIGRGYKDNMTLMRQRVANGDRCAEEPHPSKESIRNVPVAVPVGAGVGEGAAVGATDGKLEGYDVGTITVGVRVGSLVLDGCSVDRRRGECKAKCNNMNENKLQGTIHHEQARRKCGDDHTQLTIYNMPNSPRRLALVLQTAQRSEHWCLP